MSKMVQVRLGTSKFCWRMYRYAGAFGVRWPASKIASEDEDPEYGLWLLVGATFVRMSYMHIWKLVIGFGPLWVSIGRLDAGWRNIVMSKKSRTIRKVAA